MGVKALSEERALRKAQGKPTSGWKPSAANRLPL